jgi:hypothetical protein
LSAARSSTFPAGQARRPANSDNYPLNVAAGLRLLSKFPADDFFKVDDVAMADDDRADG